MARTHPWRNRCSTEVAAFLQRVGAAGLLVVQQPGPTSFVLKDTQNNRKYKVRIGEEHQCNCRSPNPDELCIHIVFVLSKVFRLPHDNPLVWQRSLLAAEVDQLIRGHIEDRRRKRTTTQPSDGKTAVPRRPLEEGDSCPICCDDLDETRAMVYCRYGCGNNIHSACFRQYATHNSTNPSPLLCPLCREQWGPLGEGPSHGVACSDCRGPINGARYRCAFCQTYDLCNECFQCPTIHPQHPFNVSLGPGLPFTAANRPVRQVVRQPQPTLNLGDPTGATANGTAIIHPMMLRELGPEDYEELLRLDEQVQPVASQLFTVAEVHRLPTKTWSPALLEEAGGSIPNDTCAVCLDLFTAESEVTVLPMCKHAYHVACATRWLTECRAVCPIDNIPVPVPGGGSAPPTTQPSATRTPPVAASNTGRTRRDSAQAGAAPPTQQRRAQSNDPRRRTQARNRFDDDGAAQRLEQVHRHQANRTLNGYCPTDRDLSMLFVGAPTATPATAVPLPSVVVTRSLVPRGRGR